MKDAVITRRKIDLSKEPDFDWSRFDAKTDAEVEADALSDPDAQPLTEEQLRRMKRGPNPRIVRARLGLTQEEFAKRFHLPLGTVRDWEQGKHEPDSAARVLLRLIDRDPAGVAKALAG
jgi:putative transcriptional regulator